MASGTAAGCVSAITRVASGRPRCAREDFPTGDSVRHEARETRDPRGPGVAHSARAVASPTANTAVSTFRDGEITGDESDEALVKTRVAREAEMASLEFEKIWTSDAAVRGIITGERAANADSNRPPVGTARACPAAARVPAERVRPRARRRGESRRQKSKRTRSAAAFANNRRGEAGAGGSVPDPRRGVRAPRRHR